MGIIKLLTDDDLEFFKAEPCIIEDIKNSENELNAIYQHLLNGTCTFTSKNRKYHREALVHDSPINSEFKRITTFDGNGPIGHSTRDNLKDIALEIYSLGFVPADKTELKFLN